MKKVLYNPFSRRKHLATGRTLELADMMKAKGNYKLVSEAFEKILNNRAKSKEIQLPLFPTKIAS